MTVHLRVHILQTWYQWRAHLPTGTASQAPQWGRQCSNANEWITTQCPSLHQDYKRYNVQAVFPQLLYSRQLLKNREGAYRADYHHMLCPLLVSSKLSQGHNRQCHGRVLLGTVLIAFSVKSQDSWICLPPLQLLGMQVLPFSPSRVANSQSQASGAKMCKNGIVYIVWNKHQQVSTHPGALRYQHCSLMNFFVYLVLMMLQENYNIQQQQPAQPAAEAESNKTGKVQPPWSWSHFHLCLCRSLNCLWRSAEVWISPQSLVLSSASCLCGQRRYVSNVKWDSQGTGALFWLCFFVDSSTTYGVADE